MYSDFNKKLLILFSVIFAITLMSSVSAVDFDNRGDYDEETRTMTINNLFGLGGEIAKIRLVSDPVVYVIPGEERKVAELEFISFDKSYSNALKSMEFYDINKDFRKFERDFVYKKKVLVGYNKIQHHSKKCKKCEATFDGYEEVPRYEWIEITSVNELSNKDIVGIFTSVKKGDHVEWIPTFFGIEIEEWAEWSDSLSIGLAGYWKFDGTTGDAEDSLNLNDGRIGGTIVRGLFTKINNSFGWTDVDSSFVNLTTTQTSYDTLRNFSLSFWMNSSQDQAERGIFWKGISGAANRPWNIITLSGGTVYQETNSAAAESSIDVKAPCNITGEVYHIVVTRNDSTATMYCNGTRMGNTSASSGNLKNHDDDNFIVGVEIGTMTRDHVGNIDEVGYWNRTLTSAEVVDLYDTGTGITYIQPGNVSIALNLPVENFTTTRQNINFSATLTPLRNVNLTNATVYLYNSSDDLINDTVTNLVSGVFPNVNNTNLSLFGLDVGLYSWNVLGCVDDNDNKALCNFASRNFSFNISRFAVNNESFNAQTTEGGEETFEIILNITPTLTFTPNFFYNETDEGVGVKVSLGGDSFRVLKTIMVPNVASPSNKSFFWKLDFSDGASINTTNLTQEILNLDFDNCTANTFQLFNYTMVDEEEQTDILNPEIEFAANLYSLDRTSLLINFSQAFNETPVQLCSNVQFSNGTSYSFDSVVKYTAPAYAIEYYNIANSTVNNNTENQNIILFDLNSSDSTDFQLTFTGSDFLPVEDALVFVDRQYVAENIFKTVELPKTDANGQTILHLVRNDIVYNIRIAKNGQVLGNFESITAFCEDFVVGNCKIILNAQDSTEAVFDYNSDLGITFIGPTFDNSTNVVDFSFLTSDGTTKTVLMQVNRNDVLGNRSLCNDSITSTGGSLTCTVSNVGGSVIRINVFVDGVEVIITQITLDDSNYGNAGYLIFFVMAITLILAFSGSKSGVLFAIILSVAGGIGLSLISGELYGFGASALWIILVVVIGLWKLNKEKPD